MGQDAIMGNFFATLSAGLFAIVTACFLLLLFLLAMGLLTLLAIKTQRILSVYIRRAAREPESRIVQRFKKKEPTKQEVGA